MASDSGVPLVARYPALRALPRVPLGRFPSPIAPADALAPGLWFKREDLNAEPLGGNKVRALEFLLGGLRSGDALVTVGAAGSTHVLATVICARRLGARPRTFRWRQEMNAAATCVAQRLAKETGETHLYRGVVGAYAAALFTRLRGARWIPAGGSSPLGILGQVNAALEVAHEVNANRLPRPDRVVVPFGTGGTVAGLALGFAIAGMPTEIVGVRVVPRVVANARHVRRLISRTARLIEKRTGESVPRPTPNAVRIAHQYFGGAYGRVTESGDAIAKRCHEVMGISVDPTYTAKALAAAVDLANERGGATLFWLSFDGRWMQSPRCTRSPVVAS